MRKLIVLSVALLVAGAVSAYAAEAKAIWTKDCAKCHGPDGKGQTMMGKRLQIKDLTEAKVQDAIKDEEIAKDIKDGVKEEGKTKMKGFGDVLSEQEIKDLVKYVRSLKK